MVHKTFIHFCFVSSVFIAQLPTYGQQARKLSTLNRAQKSLLQQIAGYGIVESKNIGWTGIYSEQYARVDSLKRISAASDIILLVTHRSPIVKVYAFQMLLESKDLNHAFTVL